MLIWTVFLILVCWIRTQSLSAPFTYTCTCTTWCTCVMTNFERKIKRMTMLGEYRTFLYLISAAGAKRRPKYGTRSAQKSDTFSCSLFFENVIFSERQIVLPSRVFFNYWWGGTSVTRYCGHFWPIVQPQMMDEGDCGAIGGMKIGRGNRSTRRKPAPPPLCPPQIPLDQTRARTRAAAVGSPSRVHVLFSFNIGIYSLYLLIYLSIYIYIYIKLFSTILNARFN
jgi:hypothetical protein